jgi:hypothetical protein
MSGRFPIPMECVLELESNEVSRMRQYDQIIVIHYQAIDKQP